MEARTTSTGSTGSIAVWLTICAIFLVDLWLAPGYFVSSLYVAAVLLTVRTPRPRLAYGAAAAATLGIILHTVQVPDAPALAVILFNRGILIATLWVAAVLVVRYRQGDSRRRAEASARDAAERTLRERDKDLEDIKYAIDQSAIVATTNVAGDITYVNDKFCEISKYSRDELIGQNHRIVNSGLHPAEFFREMYRTIGQGQVWRGEIRNRAKDGTFYWVDTTIVPFVDTRQRPYQYIAIRYDITDRKHSEERLRQQSSLAQIGKMAAVVAHEVRNPLAGIRGAIQVIGQRLPAGSTEQGVAKEVVGRIDTLDDIVQDLLQFARPRQPVLAPITARELIDQTIGLLNQDPKFGTVTIRIDTHDGTLLVDAEQMKLVLSNLLINAAQAMEGAGEIHVSTRAGRSWHEIRIADRGPGMTAEVVARLFEPFFTTKHRGTGLGLATARRIALAHGGTLDLETTPGQGTTAILRLPLAARERSDEPISRSAIGS